MSDSRKNPRNAAPPRAGRRPNLTMLFASRLLAHRLGCSENHGRALLREEGAGHLDAEDWHLVARCIELGIQYADDFMDTLREAGRLE